MTSVYRLADETEEFRFIPSKNHKITAIENIRKRKHPSRKEEHKREQHSKVTTLFEKHNKSRTRKCGSETNGKAIKA